jgi:hypothetical protein
MHFAATIERAEKQIILARHGRRLLNLLDDTPVVPGDTRPAFECERQARQILNDAEEELREWQPNLEPVESSAMMLERNLMPAAAGTAATVSVGSSRHGSPSGSRVTSRSTAVAEDVHPAYRKGSESRSPPRRAASGSTSNGGPSYETELRAVVV